MRIYADRDHVAQGEHYLRHVAALTAEGLYAKSAIAGELAHRDIEIKRLADELRVTRELLDTCISKAEHEKSVSLVLDAGLATGHADTPADLMAEVLSQIKDLYISKAELREAIERQLPEKYPDNWESYSDETVDVLTATLRGLLNELCPEEKT